MQGDKLRSLVSLSGWKRLLVCDCAVEIIFAVWVLIDLMTDDYVAIFANSAIINV